MTTLAVPAARPMAIDRRWRRQTLENPTAEMPTITVFARTSPTMIERRRPAISNPSLRLFSSSLANVVALTTPATVASTGIVRSA